MSDEDDDDKWCRFCGKKEGATSTKKFCGEAEDDSGAHSFIQRELVDAPTSKKYTFACGSCPDAKAYPHNSRPNMKTSSGGKTCRNVACEKYKPIKSEVKSDEPPSSKRSRTSLGRTGKVPTNATEEEKIAIKDQQKEVAELRAQLEIAETKLRLMLEAKKMDEDEEDVAGEAD